MQRKFLTNLILLVVLNLLIKPFWIFGIDRTVQNVVGAEDYGFYFTIFNFAFLFNMLLDAGITNFNNRNIAQNHQLLNKHFSSIAVLRILLLLVYSVVIFVTALIIGYKGEQLQMLFWVAANNFLLSTILYLRSNISGLLLFRTDSFLSVLDRALMIMICGVLIWGNVTDLPFRIEWFVYAQTVAYVITLLVSLAIVAKKAAFRKFKWNGPFFIVILKQSFPYAMLILLMSDYNRVDSVFIERLLRGELGYRQSGIYAMGFRLLDAVNQMALLFAVLLLPIFSKMIKQKLPLDNMVRLPFTLLITTATIVAAGSYFYSHEIMQLLYPQHIDETSAEFLHRIDEAGNIFKLLMFCFLGSAMMYVFSTLLTANENLKQLNIIAATGIVINFALNIILVPKFYALGSAYASLTTQIFTGLAYVIVVQQLFKFKVNYRFLIMLGLFFSGTFLMGYLSKLLTTTWLVNFSILVVASLLLASALRLLSIRSFIQIIRQKEE